jgi:hypothetical protein
MEDIPLHLEVSAAFVTFLWHPRNLESLGRSKGLSNPAWDNFVAVVSGPLGERQETPWRRHPKYTGY